MPDSSEIGRFLRRRREQLDPADFEFPVSSRRRTPGLRREEVATLAGISVDYLIRLEQGRDRAPSASVVGALARALRLSDDEHRHLAALTGCAKSPELCPRGAPAEEEVHDNIRVLLDQLHPTPAVLLGPWYDVLAFNPAWERVMTPTGALDNSPANLARFLFTDARARRLYPEWDDVAEQQVAVLREASVRWRDDARVHAIIDELSAVPEFARRWENHEVARRRRGSKVLSHPTAGDLCIDYEVLAVADESDRRLVAWMPADEATVEALEQIVVGSEADRRAGLRIVGG